MSTGALRSGPAALRAVALGFLRRFGLVCAVWSLLLAATAPAAARPHLLWGVVAAVGVWALLSQLVASWWVWGGGWLLAATALELTGPAAGTGGWSVVGGASFLVIAAAATTGRRRIVVGVVALLAIAVLLRPVLAPGWHAAGGVSTLLILGLGAMALTWLMRTVTATVAERDRLQAALAEADRSRAVAAERAEAAARLHDSVLQTLSQLERTAGDEDSARLAATASADLRAFLRAPREHGGTLRSRLDAAVRVAAGSRRARVGFAAAGADPEVDERLELLVAAAAEAVRNAVAHTDGPVRVTCEATRARATVWVSDRGSGFATDAVPTDRLGVRDSIVGRLERAGGSATPRRSSAGFEWELTVPRSAAPDAHEG